MPLLNPYNCIDHTWIPKYDQKFDLGSGISVITANNPGTMTLQGTNTWVIHSVHNRSVVIDPGPDDIVHINSVAKTCGSDPIILLTHNHHDHSDGAIPLALKTQGKIRSYSSNNSENLKQYYGTDITPGENTLAEDNRILYALTTPGHTHDSLSFIYIDSADKHIQQKSLTALKSLTHGHTIDWDFLGDTSIVVFTGDTLLGYGSTILLSTPNPLHYYMQSLTQLSLLPKHAYIAPGHGIWGELLHINCARNYNHRLSRLIQLRTELEKLNINSAEADPIEITRIIYTDIPDTLFWAAVHNITIQLEYLTNHKEIY